jgi:hypothetical protein
VAAPPVLTEAALASAVALSAKWRIARGFWRRPVGDTKDGVVTVALPFEPAAIVVGDDDDDVAAPPAAPVPAPAPAKGCGDDGRGSD